MSNRGSRCVTLVIIVLFLLANLPMVALGSSGTRSLVPEVSITVEPDAVDFGSLAPGDSSIIVPIFINNTGNCTVNVSAQIGSGSNALYEDGLHIDGALWNQFNETLNNTENLQASLQLQVPISYSTTGTTAGTLIFWAEAVNETRFCSDSWNQFHGDAAHRGCACRGPGVEHFSTPRFVVGSNLTNSSSPCVMDDKIFAYGSVKDTGGEVINSKIAAFNESTGEELWSRDNLSKPVYDSWSSPAADPSSNSVYIGTGASLYRLDAVTGGIIWNASTTDAVVNPSPTINVDDELVYIHTYGGFASETTLYAMNISDGGIRWNRTFPGQGQTSVVYDAERGRIYTATNVGDWAQPGRIKALDAATGADVWESTDTYAHASFGGIAYDCVTGTVMAGGYNFFGGNSTMLIVNASDGNTVAEVGVCGGDYTPAIGDNFVYVTGDGGTTAVNTTTGERAWFIPEIGNWTNSVVYAADDGTGRDVIYVGGDDGFYLLDADNGTVLAAYGTRDTGTAALTNGSAYFIQNGSLVALGPGLESCGWYDFPPGVEETHLGEQWIRTDLFTTDGGETGCCFLDDNVLVISRNGGWGPENAAKLDFNFYYPNGTTIVFNHTANTADGEEQYYGSYAITNGARFGGSMNRLIISNGFYCDGDPADPIGTYGVTANWHYDANYKFGDVHVWSSFPLIGANVPLTDDFDKQDVVTVGGVTYAVGYGNTPSAHTLHIGKNDSVAQSEDIEGLGATWPSVGGGENGNMVVFAWMRDAGGVGILYQKT